MRVARKKRISRWACGCLLVLVAPAAAQSVTVADPGTYVVDRAGVIDPATERSMESLLADLERKTTAQVKVLTVQTTDDEPFFNFVQRHFDLWKLGQQGKDNGALIVLAVKQRQVRIHTGYGLESVLPDSWSGSASREVAQGYFKAGAYSAGLYKLTGMVADRVARAAGVQIAQSAPAPPAPPMGRGPQQRIQTSPCCCFVAVVGALLLLSVFGRGSSYNRRGGRWWPWMLLWMLMSSGRRSHWGGGMGRGFGGGFGGGGFGGGFGGGHFGGGGRSGGGGGGASW